MLPTLRKTFRPVRQKNLAAKIKFGNLKKFDFLKLDVCMLKFGRLKTVEERKITGSYGRRRAVNPVLINVWELETSEGFPTTAHLSNRSLWFTVVESRVLQEWYRGTVNRKAAFLYTLNLSVLPTLGKTFRPVWRKNLAAETKIRPNNKFDFLKVLGSWKTLLELGTMNQ